MMCLHIPHALCKRIIKSFMDWIQLSRLLLSLYMSTLLRSSSWMAAAILLRSRSLYMYIDIYQHRCALSTIESTAALGAVPGYPQNRILTTQRIMPFWKYNFLLSLLEYFRNVKDTCRARPDCSGLLILGSRCVGAVAIYGCAWPDWPVRTRRIKFGRRHYCFYVKLTGSLHIS